METKFQTSFIPRKPLPTAGAPGGVGVGMNFSRPQAHRSRGNSLFFNLSILLFIISLGAAGGMYGWKSYMQKSQEDLKNQLADRENQFNPSLIEELKRINVEIDSATRLLNNHIALSNVFDIISRFTVDKVRFTSFDLSAPQNNSGLININMKGYGTTLSVVAFQSDVFSKLDEYGLRKIVKNPILANPSLDDTNTISFDFSAAIDPSTLLYKNSVSGGSDDASSTNQ
ncbi:MAG: hypothetical protein M1459_02490 [Patescibacteria group bacterium]|nr:hypothetical protein [Patescibacteria group bacterium]